MTYVSRSADHDEHEAEHAEQEHAGARAGGNAVENCQLQPLGEVNPRVHEAHDAIGHGSGVGILPELVNVHAEVEHAGPLAELPALAAAFVGKGGPGEKARGEHGGKDPSQVFVSFPLGPAVAERTASPTGEGSPFAWRQAADMIDAQRRRALPHPYGAARRRLLASNRARRGVTLDTPPARLVGERSGKDCSDR